MYEICASTCDFGTYRIDEQRRRGRVCANAQTRPRLQCSHTQGMDVIEYSELKIRPLAQLYN